MHQKRLGVVVLALAATVGCTGRPEPVTDEALSMEAFLSARWPSRPNWSPDSQYVAYLSTDWREQDLYVVPRAGGPATPVTSSGEFLGGATWNSAGSFGAWLADGSGVVFESDGDLVVATVPDGELRRLTETPASERDPVVSPDGTRLAFQRDGRLVVLQLDSGREEAKSTLTGVSMGEWAPVGDWIAASVGDPGVQLAYSPPYSGPLLEFRRFRGGQRDAAVVSAATGEMRRLLPSPDRESIAAWAPDGRSLVVERTSLSVKDRALLHVNLDGEVLATLYTQHDPRYLNSQDRAVAFSPDASTVMFTSDADGYNHLYLVAPEGGSPRQLTSGEFEVSFPSWSPDGSRIYFVSTEGGTEQRQVYSIPAAGGDRTRITDLEGLNTTATLSPDGGSVAFVHTDAARLPDLWVIDAEPGGEAVQLTRSMTDALLAYDWQAPEVVTYPGHDGLPIRAQLFLPRDFDPDASYPAVVHVHQAAIYQEVFQGPGPHKDNVAWYGWHQRMADRGYVILNVDFRGSYGYGRDFRTANHLDVGVGDAADVIEGVAYLSEQGFVDMDRVGVYGMSYGGHMVLTLMSKYPDVFAAGVNIAGVYDFEMEGGPWDVRNGWMYARLGTPEENPEAYFNASAANFIEELSAPVLTIQGTADVHVNFLQSIRLVDDLLRLGKRFEFEVYPGEPHFFSRRSSWVDAFGKMERFFDTYVAGRSARLASEAGPSRR